MTSEKERFKEFLERCMEQEKGNRKKVKRVDDLPDQMKLAERYRNQSNYHEKAARNNLDGETPLISIKEGYYAMLHKTNEALALNGFKSNTHECTLLGLRGIFNKPELTNMLRRAKNERKNVDYYINPKKPKLEEFKNTKEFIKQLINPYLEQMNQIIEQIKE